MRGEGNIVARLVWSAVALISRTVNVTNVDGAAFSAHTAGMVPGDTRNVDGAALGTHVAGYIPSDARYHRGTALPAENVAGYQVVDVVKWAGTAIGINGGRPSVTVDGNNDKTGYSLTAGSYSIRASSTQRGVTTPNGATTASTTISAVTMARATEQQNGDTPAGATGAENEHTNTQLTTTTNIQVARSTVNDSTTTPWNVTEFF